MFNARQFWLLLIRTSNTKERRKAIYRLDHDNLMEVYKYVFKKSCWGMDAEEAKQELFLKSTKEYIAQEKRKKMEQTQDPFIRQVYCTVQFEALHHWPDAPENVSFLRDMHRHIFHVVCVANVTHNNRDIEFITMKHDIEAYCNNLYSNQRLGCTSCEMIAEDFLESFPYLHSVTVSEDNENGAIVTRR